MPTKFKEVDNGKILIRRVQVTTRSNSLAIRLPELFVDESIIDKGDNLNLLLIQGTDGKYKTLILDGNSVLKPDEQLPKKPIKQLPKNRYCNRCHTPVKDSKKPDRPYYCPVCKEYLFPFETVEVKNDGNKK